VVLPQVTYSDDGDSQFGHDPLQTRPAYQGC